MTVRGREPEDSFLCSELVTLRWTSEFGGEREVVANLEEIRASGATLQCPGPIRPNTAIRIETPKMELAGAVRTCNADFIGYFVEVDFDGGIRWSREEYEPEHFFDPRSLIRPDTLKLKNNELLAECCHVLDVPRRPASRTTGPQDSD